MPTISHERKQAYYFRAISEIVSDIKNVEAYWPTVTAVKLTNDNSHLYVYVTFARPHPDALALLQAAKGFARSELARVANQRIVPDIHFAIDDAYERGQKIEAIIKKTKSST